MFNFIVVSLLSCVQLFCNPINCSLPGSSVHGITQARILAELMSGDGVILTAHDLEHGGEYRSVVAYYSYYRK